MLTKADFQQAIRDTISNYPAIAPLFQAGDPRILQPLDAMAVMLAMYSAQLEVAQSEPFEKVREGTILADAAMRGIIRKATPMRARINALNKGASAFLVESGRTIIDSSGFPHRIATSVSVPAGNSATFETVQLRTVSIIHTVSGSEPFYAIEIPAADDGSFLCGIAVSDVDGEFAHRDRYVNTFSGDRVFHVEADDRQRVYVRFGLDGVVGIQPKDGHQITLSVSYTAGDITVAAGSPFSFEYIGSPLESSVELTMSASLIAGQLPPEVSVLRDLSKYPSVYDSNAVFLGEFDFLVRRNFTTLQFLSVWNESAEEQARGANIENINTLFVACLSKDGLESVLTEANPATPIPPAIILEAALTSTQIEIRRVILAADDSYKVKFTTPVRSKIGIAISATVSSAYIKSEIEAAIKEAIIAEYGESTPASKRGHNRPLYQGVYSLLKKKIPALSVGNADLRVDIIEPVSLLSRPEMWRYVAMDSLSVVVNTVNVTQSSSWGG